MDPDYGCCRRFLIREYSWAISDVQISVLQAVASEQSQKIDHI